MQSLIKYSVSSDISVSKVHILKLRDEIIASGFITALGSVSLAGDEVEIIGGSINNQAGLDGVLATHLGVDLDRTKANAKLAVDIASGKARARYTTEVEGQQATYLMKEQDCQKYKDAQYPEDISAYHFLVAELNAVHEVNLEATAQQVADTVLATSAAWRPLAASIEELRRGYKEQINIATSEATVENLKDAAVLALNAI